MLFKMSKVVLVVAETFSIFSTIYVSISSRFANYQVDKTSSPYIMLPQFESASQLFITVNTVVNSLNGRDFCQEI